MVDKLLYRLIIACVFAIGYAQPGSAEPVRISGPMQPAGDVAFNKITPDSLNTVFIGEHSSILSNKTWVGVVPAAVRPFDAMNDMSSLWPSMKKNCEARRRLAADGWIRSL